MTGDNHKKIFQNFINRKILNKKILVLDFPIKLKIKVDLK